MTRRGYAALACRHSNESLCAQLFCGEIQYFDGLVLRELKPPEPGPREVLIRIAASSLNFRDLRMLRGQYGGPLPNPGFVRSLTAQVRSWQFGLDTGFSLGDRVAGIFRQNWLGGKMPLRALASDLGGSRDGVLADDVGPSEES